MGKISTDIDAIFEVINISSNFSLDIVIEPSVLEISPIVHRTKFIIDDVIYDVKDINNQSCMIYSTKEKKIPNETMIYDVFNYSDKIMGYIKDELKSSYRYVEIEWITFILNNITSNKKIIIVKGYSDIHY